MCDEAAKNEALGRIITLLPDFSAEFCQTLADELLRLKGVKPESAAPALRIIPPQKTHRGVSHPTPTSEHVPSH